MAARISDAAVSFSMQTGSFATSVALLALLAVSALYAQSSFSVPKHHLTEAESAPYLAAMRKVWVEVDPLSDAKPIAACFIDSMPTTTDLTLVDKKEGAEVVLRFFTMRDLDATVSLRGDVSLSALLLNDEMVWQGHVGWNLDRPRPSSSLDRPCQDADALAAELREAMRKARAVPAPCPHIPCLAAVPVVWPKVR